MLHYIVSLLLALPATAADSLCEDTDKVYKECASQEELYSAALEQAKVDKKTLVVVIGAEWCPWCISLHRMFHDSAVITPELGKKYSFVGIALYPAKDSKTKIPTGLAVRDKLAKQASFKGKFTGIPILAVVNPSTGKTSLIDTEPLEKNTKTSKGHDSAKVLASLAKAAKKVK